MLAFICYVARLAILLYRVEILQSAHEVEEILRQEQVRVLHLN